MATSSNLDAKTLFCHGRLPSGLALLLCLVYAPVGLCLLVMRMSICLQAFLAFSLFHSDGSLRRTVVRLMSAVLGLLVRVEQTRLPDGQPRLLLANHVSCLDGLAVQIATGCDSVSPPDTLSAVQHALRQHNFSGPEAVRQYVTQQRRSLLLQPEGANTNGRTGLLRFSAALVPSGLEVQPVAVRAVRLPVADLSISTLTSAPLSDLIYFFFVPTTLFRVSLLAPMTPREDEPTEEFVERVRAAIALHLKLTPTTYTAADKAELAKRAVFRPPPRPAPAPAAAPGGELQQLAVQVKEVLPRVPLHIIVGDLKRTRSVDQTIANLLEGVVRYVPEPEPAAAAASAASGAGAAAAPPPPGGTDLCTAATTFAKSSSDRELSFHERKQRLIENARRRYIERYGLSVPGYNC